MALVTSAPQLFAKGAEVATRRRCLLSQPALSISDIHLVASAVMVPREADPETTVLGRSADLRHA